MLRGTGIATKLLSNHLVRYLFPRIPGRTWRGWLIGKVGYNATVMVHPDEVVFLCGIFNSDKAKDFSKTVGASGRVVVVEANPETAARLSHELSDYRNVQVLNYAIWNKQDSLQFQMVDQGLPQGFNRVKATEIQPFPSQKTGEPRIEIVQADTLVNIANSVGIDKIDHVNLTINGAEVHALESVILLRLNNPTMRVYVNTEIPDPGNMYCEKLVDAGFSLAKSKSIITENREIDILRIYAT